MGVPALEPSFRGGGECSFIPCCGKWNPALHLLHGRSKIIYRSVLSNELRGESSYLGGLGERERGDREPERGSMNRIQKAMLD